MADRAGPVTALRSVDGIAGRLLVAALVLVTSFGLVGVVLAVAGVFRPLPVFGLGLGGAVALLVLWDLRAPTAERSPSGSRGLAWFCVLLLVLGVTAVNARWSGEHVLMDRDPAIYVNGAEWLRTRGDLVVQTERGPFASDRLVTARSAGMDGRGSLQFQGLHLLPAWAATVHWLGGDRAMTHLPAYLAGLMLLVVFGLGLRVVRPAFAFSATALLAVLLPFTYFARDFYSEWGLGLLLLGGAWLLDAAMAACSPRRALVAGVVTGTAALARIDALLSMVGLVAFLAAWTILRHPPEGDDSQSAKRWGRSVLAFAGGLLAGVVVVAVDGGLRSSAYLRAHRDELHIEGIGVASVLVVSLAISLGVVAGQRRRADRPHESPRPHPASLTRRLVALGTGSVVVLVAAFLAFVRPELGPAPGLPDSILISLLQKREGLVVDGTRSYGEVSFRWLVWYLGAAAMIAAVAGAAWWVVDAVLGRLRRTEWLLLFLGPPPLLIYLLRPSIYPDHPWAMRRFLPVALPLLCILVAVLANRLWSLRQGRWVARPAALAVVAASFVTPLQVIGPLHEVRPHHGELEVLRRVCARLPPDAAVLIVDSDGIDPDTLAQPVRTFCGVPTASVISRTALPREHVAELRRAWADRGRRLWILAGDNATLARYGVHPAVRARSTDDRVLSFSISRRPDRLRHAMLRLAAGPVEP